MSPRERGSVGGPVPVSLRSCFLCYDHASSAHQFVGPRHLQLAERRRGLQVATFKHLPGGVMHPPLGWLSCRRGGIGPTYGTRFLAARTPTSATVPVQRPDLKLAGQHAYQGRRNEPRNYRSHHRGLGHYHLGDSDPAADLARRQRETGPGGSKYARCSICGTATSGHVEGWTPSVC